MRRIAIFMMTICLLCGLLSGCIPGASGDDTPAATAPGADVTIGTTAEEETAAATEEPAEFEEIPEGSVPFHVPDIETVPPKIDDSDYQLPPGETPTYEPQVS